MQKIVLAFFLTLALGPTFVRAENSPQVTNFLKQLNLRYYCLNREGLQNFSCTMKMTLPPGFVARFKDQLRRNNIFKGDPIMDALNGVEYTLTVSGDKAKVITSEPSPTGDDQVDDIVIKESGLFQKLCEQIIQVWVDATVSPAVTDEELSEEAFQVRNGANGFTMEVADPEGNQGTEIFDAQASLQSITANTKAGSVSIHTGYTGSPKGYVLQSWDMKEGDTTNHSSITYAAVDKYWLPQKWTFHLLVPGALSEEDEFTMDFSDYSLNHAGKDHSRLRFVSRMAEPVYHYDFGISQIEKQNKEFVPSRNVHELGLTSFYYRWGTDFGYESRVDPNNGSALIWVTQVYAEFSAPKFDIYIADKYSKGSCAYQAVLDHENTHVAIDQTTFRKYQGIIQQALETDKGLPTKENPWKVKNLKQGKVMVKNHLDDIVGPLVKKFWAEMGLANGRIDLPDSYARVHARCQDW